MSTVNNSTYRLPVIGVFKLFKANVFDGLIHPFSLKMGASHQSAKPAAPPWGATRRRVNQDSCATSRDNSGCSSPHPPRTVPLRNRTLEILRLAEQTLAVMSHQCFLDYDQWRCLWMPRKNVLSDWNCCSVPSPCLILNQLWFWKIVTAHIILWLPYPKFSKHRHSSTRVKQQCLPFSLPWPWNQFYKRCKDKHGALWAVDSIRSTQCKSWSVRTACTKWTGLLLHHSRARRSNI